MDGKKTPLTDRILKRYHDWAIATVPHRPFLLLPLLPCYLVAWVVIGMLLTLCLMCGAMGFEPDHWMTRLVMFMYLVGVLASAAALFLHYVMLLRAAWKSVTRPSSRSIGKVLQVLSAVMLFFACCHYYVHVFADKGAYNGIDVVEPPDGGWDKRTGVDRFLHLPKTAMAIDFLYFSAATVSTVGYGDITPKTPLAKLVTTAEIIAGFGLIAIVLASTVGTRCQSENNPTPEESGE